MQRFRQQMAPHLRRSRGLFCHPRHGPLLTSGAFVLSFGGAKCLHVGACAHATLVGESFGSEGNAGPEKKKAEECVCLFHFWF